MLNDITQNWLVLSAVVDVLVAVVASVHVVLTKRDTRAAIGWVGLICLTPLVGAILYTWLGINRMERRARRLRSLHQHPQPMTSPEACSQAILSEVLGFDGAHLSSLANLVQNISDQPLLHGNRVIPLHNGDEAYPAMIQAIDEATCSVSLGTYIFDNDRVGQQFLEALMRAVARKVEVRVLIDDMGARYSWPTMAHALRKVGIPLATFMPPLVPWKFQYSNLRTHRKTLVVDGRIGFTGGINIREGHLLASSPRHPVRDLHFRVEGPVVSQIQHVFADDWSFCTGEVLEGDIWFPELPHAGQVVARGIPDGPDEDFENFLHTLLGALASAERSVQIVTPYFLPDAALITALNVAALRGITVDIVLPQENNIALVQWASTAMLWQIVSRGCRVWISPPPFDHTKVMVVDELVAFVGSSNWDSRSLRLNFEFNLECYDRTLAANLTSIVQDRIRHAHRITLEELDGRTLPIKLRDGIARLASPYL